MDELDRAVGSNPTSSAKPLNRLHTSIRRVSLDVFISHSDSRTWKVLCFSSLLPFVSLIEKFIISWIHARLFCVTRPLSVPATQQS
jgi:hypothetical protein